MLDQQESQLVKDWVINPRIASLIRYKALTLSRSPGFSRSDRSDIEQDLQLLLLRKAKHFDPNRASQITFASRIIENKAKSMQRTVRRKKRDFRRSVSLDAEIYNGKARPTTLAQVVDEATGRRHTGERQKSQAELHQLKLDVSAANESLSPLQRDLAALLCYVSQFAAAGVLGISRREAARQCNALRDHYEALGFSG
jgi:RNA polymerase sigma-70 factor (ECF subfamily)